MPAPPCLPSRSQTVAASWQDKINSSAEVMDVSVSPLDVSVCPSLAVTEPACPAAVTAPLGAAGGRNDGEDRSGCPAGLAQPSC